MTCACVEYKKKKKINEQSKPKQTYRYRVQSGGYQMRRGLR